MSKKLDKKVAIIMEHFDWGQVHNVMTYLNWQWWKNDKPNGVPDIKQLKACATELLTEAWKQGKKNKHKRGNIGTGGFHAHRIGDWLQLRFDLENWAAEGDDD